MTRIYPMIDMGTLRKTLVQDLKSQSAYINRGSWQSERVSDSNLLTRELTNVVIEYKVPEYLGQITKDTDPDLPWALDHFHERVAGEPYNPPPSYSRWPHHAGATDKHIKGGKFDHTYPERMWPKYAEAPEPIAYARTGIRFDYGELGDVEDQLCRDPWTRQAYLPIWFPEDTGAVSGQRVPCTLGYHFIRNGPALDCNYFLRSCDITRHLHNDLYFTARLMLHMVDLMRTARHEVTTGTMTVFISNLHLFKGDEWKW